MCEPRSNYLSWIPTAFASCIRSTAGGISRVYVAYDEELNREVALKQLRRRYADDSQSRRRHATRLPSHLPGFRKHGREASIFEGRA